jgi:hypothetical protein
MDVKTSLNDIFGVKDKDLAHMANGVRECVEAKRDIFIDFGEGAEEIDDVLYNRYNKKATFFYKFGADRRSITLWESDNPTFHFNATLGFYKLNPIRQKREVKDNKTTTTLNLDGFFEYCEATLACGNLMEILYDGEIGAVCSINRVYDDGSVEFRFSNYPRYFSHSAIILKPEGEWEFTREYPGIGKASKDPWVVKQKAPIKNDSFGKNFLKEVGLELKKFGTQAMVRIGDEVYYFVSASVNTEANRMTVYLSSNLGNAQAFFFPMSMRWNFDRKHHAWVPDFFEDVIYPTLDIILNLNKNRNATHYVSGVQMKYMDSAQVSIINGAIFRYKDEYGDMKMFCSTPETKLRVLKLGDETQLHLEHARKMKLD